MTTMLEKMFLPEKKTQRYWDLEAGD